MTPDQPLRLRFSLTRTEMRTGDPVNPNSSRSRLSRNRRYPASRNPVENMTNVGGRVWAWVAKSTFGCLPPRTGGGVAAMTSASQPLSRPVGVHCGEHRGAVPGLPDHLDGAAGLQHCA